MLKAQSLERYQGDSLSRARLWTLMSTEDLRREAMRAAQGRDTETLWSLTDAVLTLQSGAKVSDHTRRSYQRGVHDLITAWSGENLLRPSRDAAVMWLRALESSGKSASTIRVKLASAKALYRALRWAGATTAAPFADAKAMKETTAPWDKRQPYSELELSKLLVVAVGIDSLLLLLGAHGGLRVGEMTTLCWRDVDIAGRELTVRTGKGRKTRRVTLSASLAQALLLAYDADKEHVLPFRTQPRAFQRLLRLCKKAGVASKGLHALRHYAGTRITREHNGDLEPAARHLGHSSLETTRVYAKWSDEALKRSVGGW